MASKRDYIWMKKSDLFNIHVHLKTVVPSKSIVAFILEWGTISIRNFSVGFGLWRLAISNA